MGTHVKGGRSWFPRGIESAWPDVSPWLCSKAETRRVVLPVTLDDLWLESLRFESITGPVVLSLSFFVKGGKLYKFLLFQYLLLLFSLAIRNVGLYLPPVNRPPNFVSDGQTNSLGTLRTRRKAANQLEDVHPTVVWRQGPSAWKSAAQLKMSLMNSRRIFHQTAIYTKQ